jgi:hypothetical protein
MCSLPVEGPAMEPAQAGREWCCLKWLYWNFLYAGDRDISLEVPLEGSLEANC